MKLPDHRREECLSAAIVQTMWLMAGCSLVFMVTAYASNPGWWSSVLNGNPANDYMVANQGQLKNFTSVAVSEMNATLTNAGGSGAALSNLVYGWQQDYATNGYGATNLKPSDYAGINVGQLKYVGNLVWSQLIAAGYTEYPPSWLDGSNASDLEAANLGQLKTVFNFDPAVAPAAVTGLIATPEPCGIYLTWTDPPDDPMTNLLVQEDIGGTWTTIATLDASATSYEASALTPGDSYDLQVIASNGFTSSTPTTAPSTQPLPTHPAELSGTLDTTNTYMNLSWPASSGATAYEIDREAITNATWTTNYASASSTNYADTNYASTGYRYRIRASADGTHYSAPSNVFPQPRYVIIDLGTNQIPLYFNNAGAVVLRTGTGALAYTYWSGGTNTILPLTPYGLNDNGVVIGTETNSILYGNTNTADFQVYYTPATTWTVGGGLGAPLPAPTSDYIADQPITTESYIFSEWEGSIGGTPVGIGDDNTTVYGNYGEGWQVNEGGYPLSQDAGFGARLDTLTAIGSDIVSYLESYTNNSPDPVSAGGTYYHFQTQNGANVALGYKQTVTTDDYGVYGPYQSSLGGPILPQTWVAYDGTEFDLAGIPAGIASNNDISGTDTHSPPQAFYLWTNLSTSPVTLVNGIAGAINNQDQIVSTNYYWQSNQLFNLNDLVADTNGWINIFSGNSTNTFNGAINDGGAIAATAYHLGTNHAIMLIPDSIQRDGMPINSTNNTVWVGQQINLTNMVLGSATNAAVTSHQWVIPGANNTTNDTAFYDYEPNATNSCYTNLFTPTNYTTNNYIHYYWSYGASNQTVYCTNVIYGQTNVVSATFNVSRPNATMFATNGVIGADSNYHFTGMPTNYPAWLHFGNPSGTPGINFSETNSPLPSGFIATNVWNQVINSDTVTRTTSSSTVTTNSFGYDGAYDWEYPYTTNATADDSPGGALHTNQISVSRSFSATMYLMWQAATNSVNGDKTVTVPLKSYTWSWNGTATNNAGTWSLFPGSTNYSATGVNTDVTNEPTWSTNSAYNKYAVP